MTISPPLQTHPSSLCGVSCNEPNNISWMEPI